MQLPVYLFTKPFHATVLSEKYSTAAHQLLNVPLERSVLRPSYATKYELEPAGSNRLRNPHEHIKSEPFVLELLKNNIGLVVQIGQLSAVRGDYLYYHYMQDGFDDCGWGCAYRSFQTVWSWFLLQGYTEKPVPTHREIQQVGASPYHGYHDIHFSV